MMSSWRLLFMIATAIWTAEAQRPVSPPRLNATALVESNAVRPGSTVRLALRVRVDEPFHVQSNRPRDSFVIPTTLSIEPQQGITVDQVAFPHPSTQRLKGSGTLLEVFEREFVIGVELSIRPSHPTGPLTLIGHLRYQACDDTVCFRPETLDTRWNLSLLNSSELGARLHPDIFDRIAFAASQQPPPQDRRSPGVTDAERSKTASAPSAPPTPLSNSDALAAFDRFVIRGTAGGYMGVPQFSRFIDNAESGVKDHGLSEQQGWMAIVALVFVGGLALNLTPCVLPMIPINIAIIGAGVHASQKRRGFLLGAVYGGAMALVYGALGVTVIVSARMFGAINSSPLFNFGIALLFVALGLSMFDLFFIDFSSFGSRLQLGQRNRGTLLLAFSMGTVTALLAGACVAPVVIEVIVFASDRYASGANVALILPFVLGLGMALPWPIVGAGLSALPKPGSWMVRVKQAFGIFMFGMAAYYAIVGYEIFRSRPDDPNRSSASTEAQLSAGWYSSLVDGLHAAERNRTPVLVDFWATWCKNCLVMDETTLADPSVRTALVRYTRVKFQAEDLDAAPARDLLQRIGAVGLPAYVILEPPSAFRGVPANR